MKSTNENNPYWLFIEPYVYTALFQNNALLYNTLDGNSMEITNSKIIKLLQDVYDKANHGVIKIEAVQLNDNDIVSFITELRSNFMGDMIDVSLSKCKPIQLLPGCNYEWNIEVMNKRIQFYMNQDIINYLNKVEIYLDAETNKQDLTRFLHSIPNTVSLYIFGNLEDIFNFEQLLFVLEKHIAKKYICVSYRNDIEKSQLNLIPADTHVHVYVDLPFDQRKWHLLSTKLTLSDFSIEFIFRVESDADLQSVEQIIDNNKVDNYKIEPVFKNNIRFFEENVFLTKEDILATPISIREIFIHQSINIYDFGKITVLSDGNVYANKNHPSLGNIAHDTLHDILCKERDHGQSWFRIRNQAPCNNCIYQWLCPSPSNYEIAIGRPNLCHIKQ